MDVAPTLHPDVLRLAFVFLLVGYGTKAGLAPMHTWLPDAHSEAPAPLSAMMSGVLLAVAQYAIMRWKAVVDAAVGPAFTNQVLMALGLLSIGIGALSLVRQQNYKRLLAYSSVEHSGLICLGLAFGPAGVFAALLHLLNHALAKSMSFLLTGRLLARYTSTEVDRVSGLLRTMPATGPLFAAGVLALMGLPPFGLFISEFLAVPRRVRQRPSRRDLGRVLLAGVGFVGSPAISLGCCTARRRTGSPPANAMVDAGASGRVADRAGRPRPPSAGHRRPAARPHRGGHFDMSDMHARAADIGAQLGDRLSGLTLVRGRELHARASTADMPAVAGLLQRLGADLVLMAGDDRRDDAGCFQVHYLFDHKPDDWFAHVTTDVAPGSPGLVSLAQQSYPASRFEREIRDLFGITPVGHPDPRPLVRHGFWPEDYYPLRQDALPRSFEDDGRPFPFGQVEGPGVYEIPVGPVHAGVIEPGHFRFSVVGETIIDLK